MAFMIYVKLRDGTDVPSPEMTEQEADQQLENVRNALGRHEAVPGLPWFAAMGKDVLSAYKLEV
jgi:hypothetical protein